jgi:hypothetical protein
MFILRGAPLSPDVSFIDINDIQRPANWLRLASVEERTEAGVSEQPDPKSWDQRFYWGYDANGDLIPKDAGQLRKQWIEQTKTTAGTLLAPTDWYVVREYDNGTVCPNDIKNWRQAIRSVCEYKVSELQKLLTTDSLATYITGDEYPVWPQLNEIQEEPNGSKEAPTKTQTNDAGIF